MIPGAAIIGRTFPAVERVIRNTGSPVMTIQEAADIMVKNHIGSLPICIGGKLEGMVTATDFLKFVAAS